ncbi:hypothetical protein H5410_041220 [Solanum commersonii]|uniref:Uncharacterized protein n=1 Tax=Solanum commersonii TaxID=4109 RepID=A0A9J5XSE8_SOLCO|nr:hypothetical protein H5410_041220 [Solanum commersonii]
MIFWNIRSVNAQQAFERLTNRNSRYYYKHIDTDQHLTIMAKHHDYREEVLLIVVDVACTVII